MKTLLTFILLSLSAIPLMAQVKVATLSPLLADLARQIGGDKVVVIDLLGKNGNPHTFSATSKTLQKAAGARLYLASGKGLEPYLPKLRALVGESVEVMEVGSNIRSIKITADSEIYTCCPNHSVGAIDPHWWHSLKNWQRAAKDVAKKLGKIDPANKNVPKANRYLATAHAAFGYFCKEYGFESIPLKGLNTEQSVTSQYLLEAVEAIKSKKVKAIFPDESTNPKALQTVSTSSGVRLAGKIYADSHSSIEGMFAHNVRTIVGALK